MLPSDMGYYQKENLLDYVGQEVSRQINFQEFANWYFTGMRLEMGNSELTFFKFENGVPYLDFKRPVYVSAEELMNDAEMVKHQTRVSFNKPDNPQTTISASLSLVGVRHDELIVQAKEFQAERDLKSEDKDCMFAKCVLTLNDDLCATAKLSYEGMNG